MTVPRSASPGGGSDASVVLHAASANKDSNTPTWTDFNAAPKRINDLDR
jgi:hypothetical protein